MALNTPLISTCPDTESLISEKPLREKPLSLWSFVALVFFTVSGGPFGSEPIMAAGGPFWALTCFMLFPLLWSIPEALITAELGSRFPSNTGVVSWCTGAFGAYVGHVQGWLTLTNSLCNCAVFVSLFVSYMSVAVPWLNEVSARPFRALIVLVFSTFNSYMNFSGLEFIG